ncbi:hypothetical protein AB3G33_00490 [Flavobacterium sp. WC2421]|uniref:DUF4595 domain-containing protein n=1 Tax=Flavobacterium sp. WC2409 TaxID=3234139 RepID=A0AB39VY13_9FLAO
MNKLALGLVGLMLMLFSCSSDSSGSDSPVVVAPSALVKKITTSDSAGKLLVTTTFSYDGNKIVSESWKQNSFSMGTDIGYSYRMDYSYTGNLITNKRIYVTPLGYTERQIIKIDYVYDSNGDLISSVEEHYLENYKTILKILYIKIDNNTQDFKIFLTDSRDNIETPYQNGKIFFDANRNIIKMAYSEEEGYFSTLVYDLKSNPKKNILGYNKIIYFGLPTNFNLHPLIPHLDRSNNILKMNIPGYYPTKNQYTYNTNGYPIERKEYYEYNGDKLNAIFQYFYE